MQVEQFVLLDKSWIKAFWKFVHVSTLDERQYSYKVAWYCEVHLPLILFSGVYFFSWG